MRFPRFLIGFFAALLVFGGTTYLITRDFWLTLGQTLICAFLIQFGYFAVILWLIKRRKTQLADKAQKHIDNARLAKTRRGIAQDKL